MFGNYSKIAYRSLLRNKGYSFINVIGLAIGLACSMLVLLWVFDEISFDRFHAKADRLYRITYSEEINGQLSHYALAPYPSVKAFAEEIPEIKNFARFDKDKGLIESGEKKFEEKNVDYVDPGFLTMFSFPLIKGDPVTALVEPNSVVITENIAHKLFENENPMGQVIIWNKDRHLKVTGVMKDPPKQSIFTLGYLVSMSSATGRMLERLDSWMTISGWCYVELDEAAVLSDVEKKMIAVADKYSGERARSRNYGIEYYLQKVTDIHLTSHLEAEYSANGDLKYVYIFSFIALFVLFIACINFMNLSTAKAVNRAKEVGLRKVVGAHKRKIITQFLTESFVITILAQAFALILIFLALPYFNTLTDKNFALMDFNRSEYIFGSLIIIIVTALFAGAYPAFYLSGFHPTDILKGSRLIGSSNSLLRKSLVVFQFTVSIILISATFIIMKQIDFMKNTNLGVSMDQVMVVELQGKNVRSNKDAIMNELRKSPDIISVSNSSGIPGDVGYTLTVFQEDKGEDVNFNCDVFLCDYDYLDTYGIEVVEGRNFSRDFVADTNGAFLINRAAAAKFGWGSETLGKRIGFRKSDDWLYPIVGIVDDFHYSSLKYNIEPLVLLLDLRDRFYVSIKMNTENVSRTVEYIQSVWKEFDSEREMTYFFADEYFNALYESEEILNNVVITFSVIAIIIACLGLIGLTAYSAYQRRKEIGVRKVLGATIRSIVSVLITEYIKLILIASIIGLPIAYHYFKNYWLPEFSYRTELGVSVFIIPFLIVIIFSVFISGYQALRAALLNPVESLRNE